MTDVKHNTELPWNSRGFTVYSENLDAPVEHRFEPLPALVTREGQRLLFRHDLGCMPIVVIPELSTPPVVEHVSDVEFAVTFATPGLYTVHYERPIED